MQSVRKEESMNRARRAAFAAQVADDAERSFGADGDAATLDAYAREIVHELWMTHGNLTVATARLLLRQVQIELAQRRTSPARAASRRDGESLAA
jgi:hypothetical protein